MKKNYISQDYLVLIEKLKEIGFVDYFTDCLNRYFPKAFFHAKEEGLTLNQWSYKLEDSPTQQTTVMTNKIYYDCVKFAFERDINNFLMEKTNGFLKILEKKDCLNRSDFIKFENLSFDVIFEVGGILCPLEIKISQGRGGFTGATHSTSKVNYYLLISLDIYRDIVVDDNINFINSMFISITNINQNSWGGKPSNNNSFTTFKFKVFDSENNEIDYSDGLIFGSLKKNSKNYSIIREKID